MPIGVFVELDKDIQGLAHLIELSHEPVKQAEDVVKIGQEAEFKVISIEPGEHRLGLSIKQLTEAPKKADAPAEEAKTEEAPAEAVAEAVEDAAPEADKAE